MPKVNDYGCDAGYFLDGADTTALSGQAEVLLDEIYEMDMIEQFGDWMFFNAGNYCDVDGYDYNEMIFAFCRIQKIS